MTKGQGFIVHCSLLILALLLLWPAALHPGWWIWSSGAEHSDLAITHWPNAHFTRRALWEEVRFPLWRPTIMSGAPFAANPLAGLYYPPNWLFLFPPWLPLEVGFNLSAVVHLWLAGAAMYALMRRGFGAGLWGALTAAVVYEASPKLLAHLGAGHVGWVQAWGWLPVVTLCLVKTLQEGKVENGRRLAILTGVALAMQFCADVRMAAYTLAAAVTLVLVLAVHHLPSAIRNLQFAIRPFAIFLGLTACQWLPLVALLPETTRGLMTLPDAAVWSLPWRYLVGLLLADHGGNHEWMIYVGVSTLVLAGVGVQALWRKRERRWLVGWLVGLMMGAVWFSLGENGGLFQALYRVVPGLGLLRVPPRSWVLVVFAAAALAGLGVETMGQRTRGTRKWRQWKRALLLGVGAFPPLLVVGYWLLIGTPPLNLIMLGIVTPLAIAICHSQFAIRHLPFARLAAVLLVAFDLLVVDMTFIETRPPEQVFADGRAAAEWLAAQPGHFRIYSPSYSIPQHVAELYGLELADGVDPLQLHTYADYLTRAAGLEPQVHPEPGRRGYSVTLPPFPEGTDDLRMALKDVSPDTGMLGRLGVRYVAAAFPMSAPGLLEQGVMDGVYVYLNQYAQPVAGAGHAIESSDGTVLFEYDPTPVYAGWAVSGATLVALSVGWLWKRCTSE
ncbi:MAG: hypothetical protein KKC18_09305 [Chloroflexi bacterium]|nr:hypothetical protein [Chloroflexota bacterium]